MKKGLLLFFTLFLSVVAFKCESEIEFFDNERLLFKGNVSNMEGSPMSGLPVEIYASLYLFSSSVSSTTSGDELLASGTTDANGNFSLVSLSPSNAANIYALVNYRGNQSDTAISSLAANHIDSLNRNDYTYDVGQLNLDSLLNFEIRVNRNENLTDTFEFEVKYRSKIDWISFDSNNTETALLSNYEFLNGELYPSDSLGLNRIRVRQLDTIVFYYTLVNGVEQEQDSLRVVVNENTAGFEFAF